MTDDEASAKAYGIDDKTMRIMGYVIYNFVSCNGNITTVTLVII